MKLSYLKGGETMRTSTKIKRRNLYLLRCKHLLTQAEFAAKIGVSVRGYQNIEWGERDGKASFWSKIQKVFNISDADMYSLMKIDEGEEEVCE